MVRRTYAPQVTETMRRRKNRAVMDDTPGFAQFYKNDFLSDVTIKCGPGEQQEFKGHKVVLANSLGWSRTALKSHLQESDMKVITLRGDHPEAMAALFEYCYKFELNTPPKMTDLESALFHVRIQVVADKYDGPWDITYLALLGLKDLVTKDRTPQESSDFWPALIRQAWVEQDFFGFDDDHDVATNSDYEEGKEALLNPEKPVRVEYDCKAIKVLREAILESFSGVNQIHNTEGIQVSDLKVLVKEIPQFGQDLIQYLWDEED